MMLAKVYFNKVEVLNSLNDVFLSTTVMVSDVNDFFCRKNKINQVYKNLREESLSYETCARSQLYIVQ